MNRKNLLVFFSLLAAVLIAYRHVLTVQIPSESFFLFSVFEENGLSAFKNNFFDGGLYLFADSFLCLLYFLFGTSAVVWIVFSLLLHTAAAFLVFRVIHRVLERHSINRAFAVSFFSAFIFILSPYQTEAVLWTPRQAGYILAAIGVLSGILFLIKYFYDSDPKTLLISHACFLAAVYSHESSFIFPLISILFFLFIKNLAGFSVKTYLVNVFLPHALMLSSYFMISKIWFGKWILHYGASVHLNFDLQLMASTIVKYFAKFFLLYRYLPESRHDFLHDVLHLNFNNSTVQLVFLVGAAISGSICFYFIRKKTGDKIKFPAILFLSFIISLVPVLNLDSSFLGAIISDRYGYLPSAFFYSFIVVSIFFLFRRIFTLAVISISVLFFVLLSRTLPEWNRANDYCKTALKNFQPFLSEKKVYVLNLPDNLDWIPTLRSSFEETLSLRKAPPVPEVILVAGYGMASENDSVSVSVVNEKTIEVKNHNGTTAFLHNGSWAESYETKNYSAVFTPDLSAYTLCFKEKIPADAVILYLAGKNWRKVAL